MRVDPAFCQHNEIGKSTKIETVSVPELGIEQLVLKVRIFCKGCKEPFIVKTMSDGFSTDEIGLVGGELIVPLERPQVDDLDESDVEQLPSELPADEPRPSKEHLH
jgi:hypothetical protein